MITFEGTHRPNAPRSLKLLAVCLLLCATVLPSRAQEDEPLVRPTLFVTGREISGPFDVGLRFEIEPDWYLYWINPGDAGLPLEVRWELPEGWAAGPLRFPTPEKIVKGGVTAFGYHDELVVLCRITPAQGKIARGAIRADLDWLVCEESCLPGRAQVALDLSPAGLKGAVIEGPRAKEYAAKFPLAISSLDLRVGAVELERRGSTWLATIPLAGPALDSLTDFYPELIDGFTIDLSYIQVLDDRICVRLTPETESSVLRTLRGLAIVHGRGYELEASIASQQH